MSEPQWTPAETELLRHKAFLEELRKTSEDPGAVKPAKPAWQVVLESNATAALITVVIGGIAGQIISSSIQQRQKEREQALARYLELVKQKNATMLQIFDLTHQCLLVSDDAVRSWHPSFDPARYRGNASEANANSEQVRKMRESYNALDRRLRYEGACLGLQIGFATGDRPEVQVNWEAAENQVRAYMDRARDLSEAFREKGYDALTDREVEASLQELKQRRAGVLKALREFSASVQSEPSAKS